HCHQHLDFRQLPKTWDGLKIKGLNCRWRRKILWAILIGTPSLTSPATEIKSWNFTTDSLLMILEEEVTELWKANLLGFSTVTNRWVLIHLQEISFLPIRILMVPSLQKTGPSSVIRILILFMD